VALHLACQSLRAHECDLALAGGVNALLHPETMINFCKMRMLAADGRCKTFDAAADGFVFGEGCGLVVLKRLSDALADGNPIFALIRGSAVNQDGRSNGITAPNRLAQEEVLRSALVAANLAPEQVSYIEAHGSGTALGDPIELGALDTVFGPDHDPENRLLVGSVKTNIGHLAGASGIAGLIKTVMALHHKQIPAHRNLQTLNPHLAAAVERAFTIPTALTPWDSKCGPRVAGVSSFGWSGTNAHVLLEEAPEMASSYSSRPWHCILLSAKTTNALDTIAHTLTAYLREHDQVSLADLAYTCNVGRSVFEHRRMLLCRTREEAIVHLESGEYTEASETTREAGQRPLTFLFPGMGEQYVNMARELYEHEPVFRANVDHCAEILLPQLKEDIRNILYPQDSPVQSFTNAYGSKIDLRTLVNGEQEKEQDDRASQRLKQTIFAQPALFVIEYALAQCWLSWGVRPQAMIGYSLGEYVAACIAGVFSLEDALFLVAQRARLVQSLPPGGMLTVMLSPAEIRPFLSEEISLASVTSQQLCVLAGPLPAVANVEERLSKQGVISRRVPASHALHSSMMEPVQRALSALASTITLHAPQIPYISNVTGTWITPEQATNHTYWAQHLRQTVLFADGMHEILQQAEGILLEVGPGQSLSSLALQQASYEEITGYVAFPSLRPAFQQCSDQALLVQMLGKLGLEGIRVNWKAFYAHEQRQLLSLPTYPFERQSYWIDTKRQLPAAPSSTSEKQSDIANWFYLPTWKYTPHIAQDDNLEKASLHWLIFADSCNVATCLAEHLQAQRQDVILVIPAQSFQQLSENLYSIAQDKAGDYHDLFQHLRHIQRLPQRILYMWAVTPSNEAALTPETWEASQQQGLYSFLFLAQALGTMRSSGSVQLALISNDMQDVTGVEMVRPEKATLLGICKVLEKEYPHITCRSIDIELFPDSSQPPAYLIKQLLIEINTLGADCTVAYRGMYRWTQTFEPVRLAWPEENGPFKQRGVYLITGGLGGLGLALAEHLARCARAKLVLLGRSTFPAREQWTQWLQTHSVDDPISIKIRRIQALENLGAEVLVVTADVADVDQVRQGIASVHSRFGAIHGVFHLAAIPGEGLIQFKTREKIKQVLAPKVQGTLVLASLLQKEPLDFMVLYSSSIVITGGLGESDYAAANAFLHAFSAYSCRKYPWPCIAIHWGPWQWDAWQSTLYASLPEGHARVKQMREHYGISFAEGTDALTRILASSLRQVAVLTQDRDSFSKQWAMLSSPEFFLQVPHTHAAKPRYARPNLKNPYVAPRNVDEQKVAAIWREFLGIEEIGIYDHFFELGGNSLVGMMVIARLRKEFHKELSVINLFEGPTISSFLQVIDAKQPPAIVQESQRGKLRKERIRSMRK
jgi:acyl transferase domain-containing protein